MLDVITLERILAEAAQEALRLGEDRAALAVDEKSAGQFVTQVDLSMEAHLRRALRDALGDLHIIGEEEGGALDAQGSGWAIDPIDGTSNFVCGLPMWAISVGYLHRGRSVLGAVALPELGVLMSAAEGQGLRVNQAAHESTGQGPTVQTMALGENNFEAGPVTDARAEGFRAQGLSVVRYRCAVFSLASAALGRLSGYIENGCGLWDIAGAEVICHEAGMRVTSGQIAPGRYGIDARWPGIADALPAHQADGQPV